MKALAVLLAVIFVGLAICAFTGSIHGGAHGIAHAAGLDGEPHAKHGVLYLILAALSLIWLRCQTSRGVTAAR